MTTNEADTLAYLARRGAARQWRGFLHAMLDTLDNHLDIAGRDSLLRAVGGRMAALTPLPPCDTLAELESQINEALAGMDWGFVRLRLDLAGRVLLMEHLAAPVVATQADAAGGWLAGVLEGLHGAWLAAQPGADASTPLRRETAAVVGSLMLRYGHG